MQELQRPDRLVEYFCTAGLSSPLSPLWKDGISPSSPVYSLCLVYGKDEPPASHARLDLCYYGEPANVNAGNANVFSPSCFLCLSRTRSLQPLNEEDNTSLPITDIVILYPEKGEKCPPGYLPVPVWGGAGGAAAAGRGGPYGRAVQIGYSRADSKRPLLDVVLCEGGGGSSAAAQTGTTTPGAGSGSTPTHSSSLPSVSPTASSSPAVAVSGALSPQSSLLASSLPCKVPPQYFLLKKSVAMGMFHPGLFIATLSAPSSLSSLLLRPALLDRFPVSDLRSSPLPESLPFFCFPEGAQLLHSSAPPPKPAVHTFVLTQPSGLLLHCAAVVLWEKVQVEVEKPAVGERGVVAGGGGSGLGFGSPPKARRASVAAGGVASAVVAGTSYASPLILPASLHLSPAPLSAGHHRYAPKALVLCSYHPYYRSFASFLLRLHELSIRQSPLPIERLISNLWETPLPRPSHQSVQLRLPTFPSSSPSSSAPSFTSSVTFPRPSASSLPHSDFSYQPLFSSLSVSNILLVLTAALNEKKVVLHSAQHPACLTVVAEAVRSLLFPLQWTSPFVPVVPALFSGILDAPMPVFVGVDGRYVLHRLTTLDDVCVVDVDADDVRVYGKYAQMSETLTSKVKRELQTARVETLQRKGGGDRSAGEPDADDSETDTLACRACFLHLFVSLLLNVDEFLLFPSISDDAEPAFDQLFNLPGFLSSQQQRPNRHLLRALCSTQLFSHFIEEKTYSASSSRKLDLLFFDKCCRYEAERLLTEQSKAQDASFIKRITQQTQAAPPYVVPLPDTADLPPTSPAFAPRHQAHSVFPCLDLTRMPQPRPVTLAYLRDAAIDETPAAVSSPSLQQSLSARSRATRHPLPSQQAISVSSPVLYAKSVLRDAYAVWFELYSICLPLHPTPHTALLNVWRGLARMTAQGVEPDVGIYRSVLSICGRWRKREEAMSIFETMRRNGVKPTAVTYGAYTSAMADSANELETERERRTGREHDGDAANGSAAGAAAAGAGAAVAMSASPPRKEAALPLRALFLDPYRLAADKHKRLILRAQRQQVRWSSLSMSVTHCCTQCGYEQSEGEVLTSFMIAAAASPSASPACPVCRAPFAPTLSVLTSITTHPPRLKACVHRYILGRPLLARTRRYSISVPLLPSSRLRERFLSASVMFREDMCSVNVMRVMHEVVYWNALYGLSQPHNCWDLTFLVEEAAAAEGRRIRIRRRRKGEEDEAEDSAAGSSRRSKRPMRNRTVRVNEGLRELQQTESSRTNGSRSTAEEDEEDGGRERNGSAVTRQSPSASVASTASSGASSLTSTSDSSIQPPLLRSRHVSIDASSAAGDLLSPPSTQPAASSSPTATGSTHSALSAACLLSHHEADAAVERELASLLSRRSLQPAMELFLRHRRKRRAEQDFSDDNTAAAPRTSPIVHPSSPTPAAAASPSVNASLSPRLQSLSAHDAADVGPPHPLLVKKVRTLPLMRPPSSDMTSSLSHPNSLADSSQPAATAAASSSSALSQPQRRPAASLSKSQSWNDGELMKPPPAASIATIALHAIKTGRLDGLSLTPSPTPAAAAASSAAIASDGIIAQHSVWYPVRDAGPSVPLHRHCMFEAFYTLALRRYDSYAALCEAFNAAARTLAAPYADEMTVMDAAPTAAVMVVETVLGLRKEREKKKSKADREAGTSQRELNKKPAHAAAAAGVGGAQTDDVKGGGGGGGGGVVSSFIGKSATPAFSSAESQPSTASSRAASPALSPSPVPMTFPIAYPVSLPSSSPVPPAQQLHSRSPLPRAVSNYSSPAPSRLAVPPPFSSPSTPFSSVYEQEVYGGSVSDFIGPGAEMSGQTPSRSPGSHPAAAWTREDSIEEQQVDDLFAVTEDAGVVHAAAGSPLMSPPAQASRDSSSSSNGSPGGGYRPSRSHSLMSQSATAPASPRSSLSPDFGPSSPRNGDAASLMSPGTHSPPVAASSADFGPSRMSRSASQPGDVLLQPRHQPTSGVPTPPRAHHNPPVTARSATLSSVPSTTASSSSHPPQPQANGSTAAAAQSASAASASSQHKSHFQTLYQFLMTKPTAASTAASGRGTAFSAGSVQQPAARVRSAGRGAGSAAAAAGGAAGVRRKGMSATNLDSSAKQREERDREQKTQRSR